MMNIVKFALITLISSSQACNDSPAWRDSQGYSCQQYIDNTFCQGGTITTKGEFYAGFKYSFPELNCCACGKTDQEFV